MRWDLAGGGKHPENRTRVLAGGTARRFQGRVAFIPDAVASHAQRITKNTWDTRPASQPRRSAIITCWLGLSESWGTLTSSPDVPSAHVQGYGRIPSPTSTGPPTSISPGWVGGPKGPKPQRDVQCKTRLSSIAAALRLDAPPWRLGPRHIKPSSMAGCRSWVCIWALAPPHGDHHQPCPRGRVQPRPG